MQVKYDIYGYRNFDRSLRFFQLLGTEMTIHERTPPRSARNCPSLCSFQDSLIFVIGGGSLEDYREFDDSVEVYSTETDTWSTGPSLNTSRMHHSSCAVRQTIYTFCGANFTQGDLASIERLNARDVILSQQGSAKKPEWELIQPALAPGCTSGLTGRTNPLIASLRSDSGQIMIMGGFSGGCLNDCFIYDVSKNHLLKKEKEVSTASTPKVNQKSGSSPIALRSFGN